jgi:hypothetical protein
MELKLHFPIRLHVVNRKIFPLWTTNTECVESGVRSILKVSINRYIELPKGK